jgi:hypothetical protein
LALLKETHPPKNLVPVDYYRTRKIVSKLGLTAEKIDCCVNGCMLFYTDECKQLKECKFGNAPRYKKKKDWQGSTYEENALFTLNSQT